MSDQPPTSGSPSDPDSPESASASTPDTPSAPEFSFEPGPQSTPETPSVPDVTSDSGSQASPASPPAPGSPADSGQQPAPAWSTPPTAPAAPPPPPVPAGFPPPSQGGYPAPAPGGYPPPAQGGYPAQAQAGYPAQGQPSGPPQAYPQQANPYGGYPPQQPPAAYGAPMPGTLPFVEAHFGPVATFGQRVPAYLIDWALTLIGIIPMVIGMFMVIGGAATNEYNYDTQMWESTAGSGALAGLGGLLIFLGVLVSFGIWLWNRVFKMGRTGQSVGKRMMGLKLINAETGQPVGAGTSFLREVVHSLANQIFYLSFLWMLWDANRQTLADLVVKSNDIVVPKS